MELWQEYALNGQPIMNGGRSMVNSPNTPGSLTAAASVWLYRRTKQGEIELLFQKRSAKVDHFPNQYDLSAGGHVNYQESILDAVLREAQEEIGVTIPAQELRFLMTFASGSSFRHVFCVDWTNQPSQFNFNDQEVAAVRWVPLPDVDQFCQKYVKEPLAKDVAQFSFLIRWLNQHS